MKAHHQKKPERGQKDKCKKRPRVRSYRGTEVDRLVQKRKRAQLLQQAPQVFNVDSQELKSKMCSKQDILHLLAVVGQYHIPPIDSITLPFLKEVLAGRKKLFKNSELNNVNVPRIAEFECNRLWQACLEDA